mmetsp:Transcript_63554/g.153455  ORF Transcript_63554/g.153455 Transcript_63554/m.153455 type:complete len:221 (-) Transcript_63554:605-1267(-)
MLGDALLERCQVAALHRLGELANGHFLLLTRCCVRARGALLVALDVQRALLVAGGARCLRGGAAARAAPLRACTGCKEQLDTLETAGAAGRQQRKVALAVVGRVRVGPGAEQPLDDGVVSEARGDGEQPDTLLRARLERDAFAPRAVEPLLDKVEVAELAPADLVLQPRLRPRVEPAHGVHHLHLFLIRLRQLLGIAHLLPFLHRPVVLVSLREALVALL